MSGTVPGEARACAWLHWLRTCRFSPKEAAPAQRVLDGRPAEAGRRRGPFGPTARGSSTSRGNAGTVILCMYVAAAAAAAAPGVMSQQSCTRADLLLDDDRAPCRRSAERRETHTERERVCGPPRRRRAAVSRAMAVSARRAPRRTGFPVLPRRRVCIAHPLAFVPRAPGDGREVAWSPARPPATARYV